MPLYEYRCDRCGSISEFLVGVSSEKPQLRCESCGSEDVQKILSRANFVSTERGASVEGFPAGTTAGTCCGREERCAHPACEGVGCCERD
jgi:putative FmdB family regulatory protein